MSLCNVPLLTFSLEPLHGFASNLVWMFLGRTPTKFFKSECDDHSAAWHFYFICISGKIMVRKIHKPKFSVTWIISF